MPSIPIKPEYGPTLPSLLAPSWQRASRAARAVVVVSGVLALVLLAGAVLALLNSTYGHGGSRPFHFSYRGLYRTTPEPGGYIRVQSHSPSGRLEYSFAVNPLELPPYRGAVLGEVPLYASAYIRALSRRYPGFVLRGEGKARLNSKLGGYQVAYTRTVAGRRMLGRNVLLLHERPGRRSGVELVMLTAPGANPQITEPLEVGSTGVLLRPLKTFALD
jgi:hypothetical protein